MKEIQTKGESLRKYQGTSNRLIEEFNFSGKCILSNFFWQISHYLYSVSIECYFSPLACPLSLFFATPSRQIVCQGTQKLLHTIPNTFVITIARVNLIDNYFIKCYPINAWSLLLRFSVITNYCLIFGFNSGTPFYGSPNYRKCGLAKVWYFIKQNVYSITKIEVTFSGLNYIR